MKSLARLILRLADISEIVPQIGVANRPWQRSKRRPRRRRQSKKAAKKAAKPAAAEKAPRKAKPNKYVYFFGGGKADGDRTMRDLLGGKGANLAEMTNAGLPVPPGFTITTAACML